MVRSQNLNCPKCGKEMKKGYIYTARQINWSDNNSIKLHGDSMGKGNEKLVSSGGLTMKKIEAYRCRNCRLVTFKYE